MRRFETIRLDTTAVKKTDDGYLKVPVYATRAGIFNYRRADGSVRRELRHPDQVFKADSLATLAGKPLTNLHPREPVNAKNVRKYMVGVVGENVGRKDEFVETNVTVMDDKTINEIENGGMREVSCGYKCDVVEEPGVYEGEHYDAVQVDIRYNHLATVPRGRAGRDVRLHLDSDDAELVLEGKSDPSHLDNFKGGRNMLVKIDGVEFEADNSLASAITQALEKRDNALATAKDELGTVKADAQKTTDELQGKYDQLKTDHDKVKADAEGVDVNALVKSRVALVEAAKPHVDAETKMDDMSDRDVKVAVIVSKNEKFDAEGKSDDYIQARFDAIIEAGVEKKDEKKGENKLDHALRNVDQSRKTDGEKTAEQVRDDAIAADLKAWEQPLSTTIRAVGGN